MIVLAALSEPVGTRGNPCSVLLGQLVSMPHRPQYHVHPPLIRIKDPRTVLGNDQQVCEFIVDHQPKKYSDAPASRRECWRRNARRLNPVLRLPFAWFATEQQRRRFRKESDMSEPAGSNSNTRLSPRRLPVAIDSRHRAPRRSDAMQLQCPSHCPGIVSIQGDSESAPIFQETQP